VKLYTALKNADTKEKETNGGNSRYSQNLFDEHLYPRLPETVLFDPKAMANLINGKFLTDDTKVLDKYLTNNPIAQLLYMLVWKQGGLDRFAPIKLGLEDKDLQNLNDVENNSYVFFQFGKHIANCNEPIIDQHAGRALKFLNFRNSMDFKNATSWNPDSDKKIKNIDNWINLFEIRKWDKFKNEAEYKSYMKWIEDVLPSSPEGKRNQDALWSLDKFMYSLGKMIKNMIIDISEEDKEKIEEAKKKRLAEIVST
jgi:hypothetical protein